MNEFISIVKMAAAVSGFFVFCISMMSFMFWENVFRILKPIFFLRVFVVIVVCACLIHFIPGGK